MSGGHFDYAQFKILDFSEKLEHLIRNNSSEAVDEDGDREGFGYSTEILLTFMEGLETLHRAFAYAQAIDRLISGDTGELSFREEFTADLKEADSRIASLRKEFDLVDQSITPLTAMNRALDALQSADPDIRVKAAWALQACISNIKNSQSNKE